MKIRGKISWFFREIWEICGQNFFMPSGLGGEFFLYQTRKFTPYMERLFFPVALAWSQ